MKNALIVANLAGFASFLLHDIDTLESLGYRVYVAANGKNHSWEDTKKALEERKTRFIQIDFDSQTPLSKSNLQAYGQIKELLKTKKFDLIHCHTPIAGFLCRLASRKYRKKGTKVIYTSHGFAFTNSDKNGVYYILEKIASMFCDAIITINREDYASAKKLFCRNVFYIHGVGVPYEKFHDVEIDVPSYRRSLGVDEKKVMILSVGELSQRKNHRIIIEALSLLEDKEDYVYVICGNGIMGGTGEALQRLAEEKKVDLRLLGFRNDIPEITKCSDIGALPSLREGLGLAGIQSLAAGVPVVGSNVQGIRDYIMNEKTGFLCAADDGPGFSRAITRLAGQSASQRERMKEECCKKAREFATEISVEEMRHIYMTLLREDSLGS